MITNDTEEKGFVYILDYSCDSIYCIHLSEFFDNPTELQSEDIENLITKLGFNTNEISYMYTGYKQTILDIYND